MTDNEKTSLLKRMLKEIKGVSYKQICKELVNSNWNELKTKELLMKKAHLS